MKEESLPPIRPYSKNKWYWEYHGKPVLLIGGSDDDNLYQWANNRELEADWGEHLFEKHLDKIVEVGGNLVRNSMFQRWVACNRDRDALPRYVYSGQYTLQFHKRIDGGKYDLDQWDEEHWARLETFLKMTHEREIFVVLEIWEAAGYNGDAWALCSFNPENNINYDWADVIVPADKREWAKIGAFPSANPMFWSVVDTPPGPDPILARYMTGYMNKLLDTCLPYDHVLYQVDNETRLPNAITDYWARFVSDTAAGKGKEVYVTSGRAYRGHDWCGAPYRFDMRNETFRSWEPPETNGVEHAIIKKPELYTFNDIAENMCFDTDPHWNGDVQRARQTTYDNVLWFREQVLEHGGPKPLLYRKFYDGSLIHGPGGEGWWNERSDRDAEARARMWRLLFAGVSGARHHRNKIGVPGACPAGNGLHPGLAQPNIRSARLFTDALNIFTMEPRNDLLSERSDNSAYCLAEPGKQYALYFPREDALRVTIALADGEYFYRWMNAYTSQWVSEGTIGGGTQTLEAPGANHAVLITLQADTAQPQARIVWPPDNRTYKEGGNIRIDAEATAESGIAKVEFYNGFKKLGEASSAPYSCSWQNVQKGYVGFERPAPDAPVFLYAVAYDNDGNIAKSVGVNVTIAEDGDSDEN